MTEIDCDDADTERTLIVGPFPLTLVSVTYRPPPWHWRVWRVVRRFLRGHR